MSELIVIGYNNPVTARAAYNEVLELQSDFIADLRGAAVVTVDAEGGDQGPGLCCGMTRIARKKDIAVFASVSRPTVNLWRPVRTRGLAGCWIGGGCCREQVSPVHPVAVLAASLSSPPVETRLSHWSGREMVAFIERTERVNVSHHYVAKLWRDNGLRPQQQGNYKASRVPHFA